MITSVSDQSGNPRGPNVAPTTRNTTATRNTRRRRTSSTNRFSDPVKSRILAPMPPSKRSPSPNPTLGATIDGPNKKPSPSGKGSLDNATGEGKRPRNQVCGAGPPIVNGLGSSRTGPPLDQL